MEKPELLAPVGSIEKAKTAFLYGADAIYCGTGSLSLRSRADVNDSSLAEIIEYTHSLGKKIYVTLNIYAPDDMYSDIENQVKMLNKYAADAIIVSDGGVLDIVKELAPDIPIHISTQANTLSAHTARFWYKNGAKRIILSREMNKVDMKNLTENIPQGLETEIFVHGALCWAYSGRCYLSDFMSGRNANLGDCVQSCRWAYNMYIEEKNNPGNMIPITEDEHGTYVLSSKDLCLIRRIPDIVDIGITSLKIEGRHKSEYYLASVINAYRNAIDDYIANPDSYDYSKYLKELDKVKTRELTEFFFNDKTNNQYQEYEGKQYNSNYEFGGVVQEYNEDKSIIKIGNKLTVGDQMEIIIPNRIETEPFTINKLWDTETEEEIQTVNPGRAGQTAKIHLPVKCEKGWVIRRKKSKS